MVSDSFIDNGCFRHYTGINSVVVQVSLHKIITRLYMKIIFSILLVSLVRTQDKEKQCNPSALPSFPFGYFDCDGYGKGAKCYPKCESGFRLKKEEKLVKCRWVKGKLEWRPKKYFNSCTPIAPDVCPMPSRIGNRV